MLTVIGIIGLVAGLSIPLLVPMMRTRKLDTAVETVKMACILARSKAIQERKMINVTLLAQTDATHGPGVVITDYATLAGIVSGAGNNGTTSSYLLDNNNIWASSWPSSMVGMNLSIYSGTGAGDVMTITAVNPNTGTPNLTLVSSSVASPNWATVPAAGSLYLIPGALSGAATVPPYCVHYLSNYGNNPDIRYACMKANSLSIGEQVRYLPEGCQFSFPGYANGNGWTYDQIAPAGRGATGTADPTAAWTYVFLPTGQAWTLPPSAVNNHQADLTIPSGPWYQTTYIPLAVGSGSPTVFSNAPIGPTIIGPGPGNQTTSSVITVYATTGQVVSH